MAESKSPYSARFFNDDSDSAAEFASLPLNGLAGGSEWAANLWAYRFRVAESIRADVRLAYPS